MSKKSTSKTNLRAARPTEIRLGKLQVEIAERFLRIWEGVSEEEEIALQQEIIDMERELVRTGGMATAEQSALIDDAFSQEIAVLNSDLMDFGELAQEQAGAEFRGRGLEPGFNNSPGMNRSSEIAQELQRQQGQGARGLRGQSALLKSQFNKDTMNLLLGRGRGHQGVFASNVASGELAGLRSLRIAQPRGTNIISGTEQGTTIAGDLNQGAAAGSSFAAASSRTVKDHKKDIDNSEVLSKLRDLEVQRWRYKGEEMEHIGPYAEDFQAAFGLGDTDKAIYFMDAIGVAIAGIKELGDKLDRLEAEGMAV